MVWRPRLPTLRWGEAAYTPHQGLVRLQAERARYPIADGKAVSSTQVHLTALADGTAEFWVREVGFYLADGTCLAIWSDPARPLAYKAAGVDLLLAYDLVLSALPPGSVTVQSTGAGLSLAMGEELAALADSADQRDAARHQAMTTLTVSKPGSPGASSSKGAWPTA